MKRPETEFETELEFFRREEEAAQQHFFAYLALHKVPFDDPSVLQAINRTPLFWVTLRHSAFGATFLALGRIFDQRSSHNIDRLLRITARDIDDFKRSALAHRRTIEGNLSAGDIEQFVSGKHELSAADLREMRKAVDKWRKVWAQRYRDIRDKIFAHRGISDEGAEQALYQRTNIGEIVDMLAFLDTLQTQLWEAFHNGRMPNLTPSGPQFPIPDRHHSNFPGERVYLEAIEALGILATPAK